MKKFTRLLLLILVCSLMLTLFAACKGNETPPKETGNNDDEQQGLYDENGYLRDSLPNDLKYGFQEVKILGWNSQRNEFNVEEGTTDEIAMCVFERDWTVEERLEVELSYHVEAGDAANSANYIQAIRIASQSGLSYDIFAGHTSTMGGVALNGMTYDLSDSQALGYLDFEKPWWNQSLIEKGSVNGKYYLTTGDITPTYCSFVYCVYFNEQMVNSLGLSNPYELVRNNEWTLENMAVMTKDVYQDLNHDDKVSKGDIVPLSAYHYDIPALLYGCGVSIVDRDAEGRWTLSQAFTGEKMLGLMDNMSMYVSLMHYDIGNGVAFDGNLLFLVAESGVASTHFSEIEFAYGCVPCPKYDSEQAQYISSARQPITMYAVSASADSDRLEMISATLEAMASEGYRSITPLVFDQIMKFRDSYSADMSEMLGLIRETIYFDVGRVYSYVLDYISDQPGVALVQKNSWVSYLNSNKTRIQGLLDDLFDALAK